MGLKVKTRGGSSPRGKAKVYFSCHPGDISLLDHYFELISENYNIAMYYMDEQAEETSRESILSMLEDMTLMVIPVTEDYLYSDNFARQRELPFAEQCRIPILPIVQKKGLSLPFNRICGSLQCLNEKDKDPTALPFVEKLQKHLNSVLLSDETTKKIQDAFDAWIFLSYRKKDRRIARDLMKMIHQNEYCRDIAIWYDEYLVPGEAFDKAIEEALAKSGLFALLVTPNLVNEDNYVMRVEYPLAKEWNKNIIPLENGPVDLKLLKEKFPDIPECISALDDKAVISELQKRLKTAAVRETDRPEHNYLLGLAYLGGLHVEKDPQTAEVLIKSAAEAGLPEAVNKIAEMYATGDGVKRDFPTAITWEEKYVDLLETANPSFGKDLWNLFAAREILSDWYERSGDIEKAYMLLYRIVDDLENFGKTFKRDFPEGLARGKYNLAGFLFRNKRAVEAENEALEVHEILKKLPPNERRKRSLFDIELLTGKILFTMKNYTKAELVYQEAQRIIIELAGSDPEEYEGDLADVCRSLGNLYNWTNRFSEAEKYYKEALRIRRKRYQEIPKLSPLPMADACETLALFYDGQNKSFEAEALFVETLNIRKKRAAEQPGYYDSDILDACRNLGMFYRKQKKPAEAEKMIREALSLAEDLALKKPEQYRSKMAELYEDLGMLMGEGGKAQEAEEAFLKSLDLREKEEVSKRDDIWAKINLATTFCNLGFYYQSGGQNLKAEEYYGKSIQILEDNQNKDIDIRGQMAYVYGMIGTNYFYSGKMKDAEVFLRKAYDLWKPLYTVNPEAYRQELAKAGSNIGYLYVHTGKVREGLAYYYSVKLLLEESYRRDPVRFGADLDFFRKNVSDAEKMDGISENADYTKVP